MQSGAINEPLERTGPSARLNIMLLLRYANRICRLIVVIWACDEMNLLITMTATTDKKKRPLVCVCV